MASSTTLEVLFAPAEIAALPGRDLSGTVCVVFDILRATSTMMTALGNGATCVIPVAEIAEALAIRRRDGHILLAGEREGVRIEGRMTGGIEFDLGNSPREFTAAKVRGKTIVMTTTNGTRALRACLPARSVLVGSFLNLAALARFIAKDPPAGLLMVCGGTADQAAYEDALAAGALCELIWPIYGQGAVADSAWMARLLYGLEQGDLVDALARSRNGRRLMAQAQLRDDVAFCARRDTLDLLGRLGKDGRVSGF